jgi:hypothetical protein
MPRGKSARKSAAPTTKLTSASARKSLAEMSGNPTQSSGFLQVLTGLSVAGQIYGCGNTECYERHRKSA